MRFQEVNSSNFGMTMDDPIYEMFSHSLTDADTLLRLDSVRKRMFEMCPDPITVTDYDSSRLLLCNQEFCRLTGYSLHELTGRRATDLGLWAWPQDRQRYIQLASLRGGVRGYFAMFRVKNDRLVPVSISATVFEQDGKRCLLAVMHDVSETERRRLQYEAVLSNAMVGIATTTNRIFQLTNSRYEEIFGWSPGSLIGMPASVIWPSSQAYEEFCLHEVPVLLRGAPVDIERELARRDGSRFWARIRARIVDPIRPEQAGTVWIVEDISERRHTQLALAQAKEQAEAASLAKSQFLANTSHEIRTPLNGLLGLVRLALAEQGPAQTADQLRLYLRRIQDSALTLADIISDILDLSKIEAGHMNVDRVEFDLHELLEQLASPYAELARAQGLGFQMTITPDVPERVCGDPLRLHQILGNFLSNALKFSDRGLLEFEVRRADESMVLFQVSDQGPGIAEDVMKQLFQPFSRGDASTARRFSGSGLGLSICRQLAHLMGGEVGVRSKLGEGSHFWLQLPLPAVLKPSEVKGPKPSPDVVLRGCRVLLVEDNPVNTLVAEALLQQWGVEVILAGNGTEALDVLKRETQSLDAVLMDLQMPVMDGLEATRQIRKVYEFDQLPVIALTAGVMLAERESALNSDMNDFLAKPIEPEQLAQVLSHWVNKARTWRMSRASHSGLQASQ